jgi:penicillin-binding protein 1A
MALGAVEVSPLEMAQAYAPFSNGGLQANAYGVERIRTVDGRILYQHKSDAQISVVGNPPLSYMNRMLRQVVISGTGGRARIGGYDMAGKTGTTSDYRDAWFVGYTGGFVTAVWVGKDDNTPMRKVTGGSSPADLWRSFVVSALSRVKVTAIPAGPNPPDDAYGDPINDLLNQTADETTDAEAPDDGAPPKPAPAIAPRAAAPQPAAAHAAAPAPSTPRPAAAPHP